MTSENEMKDERKWNEIEMKRNEIGNRIFVV